MSTTDTINAKEIRHDLVGFLRQMKSGRPVTVIYRSKPLVTLVAENSDTYTYVGSKRPVPGSPAAIGRSLAYAKRLRNGRKPIVDPTKSIKELYTTSVGEKYGLTR